MYIKKAKRHSTKLALLIPNIWTKNVYICRYVNIDIIIVDRYKNNNKNKIISDLSLANNKLSLSQKAY